MNKLLSLLLLICLGGCAAAEDEQSTTYTVEAGTAKQATTYILPPGYGIVRNSPGAVRCNHQTPNYSSSNPCIHAPRRNLGYELDSASCGSSNTAVQGGLALAAQVANNLGWAVAEVAHDGFISVDCVCGGGWTGGALGLTSHTMSGSGALRPISAAQIYIDICRIESTPPYTTSSVSTRDNVKTNVAKHELMHALGIAHNPTAGTCATTLMKSTASACWNTLTPGLSQVEREMLDGFDVF